MAPVQGATLTSPLPLITSAQDIPSFGNSNTKLGPLALTFALPSGFTCPGALQCLAMAHPETGKITRGDQAIFTCYEASLEAWRTNVRQARWRNFELIKHLPADPMAQLLLHGIDRARTLSPWVQRVRWFTGGDCFSSNLRDAIALCAAATPDLVHYYYTKNLPLQLTADGAARPDGANLRVTASYGGRFDHLIGAFPRTSRVLTSASEVQSSGLPIDHDDSHAYDPNPHHFGLLIHGSHQPAPMRQAIKQLKADGYQVGYNRKRRSRALAANA